MKQPHTTHTATQTERPTLELAAKHFAMLRLARLRELDTRVKRIGRGVYTVPSFSQQKDNILWVVTFPGLTCSCPAKSFCSHLAAVVNHYYVNEATPLDYSRYAGERAADRAEFLHRINAGTLTKNDRSCLKAYMRYAERRMRVKVPPVVTKIIREGGRSRTVTRCGAFTI